MDDLTDALKDLTIDQVPVYLLKTKSSPTDSYEEHISQLSNGKYRPIFVPVLDHIFRDDALRTLRRSAERFAFASGSDASGLRKATNNPAKKYGGIIFTSQRAVDAFATVIAKLDPAKLNALFDKDMPLYVVGPATANGVRALNLPCPVVGEQTGNGEALADFILQWHATLPREVTTLDGRKLPLLFLVGEQRRDTIPKALQSDELPPLERIQVTEVVVYETGELASFEETFTGLIRAAKKQRVKEQCVVVFSPQGCEAMLSALGWLDPQSGNVNDGLREVMSGPMKTSIVTIGPTTREFLVQEFGFEADVTAETPSPEGVGAAISKGPEE
ncbi:uroporphyrinogen-III synthase [Saxophila tyrrhenica]|uniref:Uroporphyrinogen-III synthase n=1 Tax=Saxophila tyrrhenica TaxID=1690608 RepID=A0AAV9PBM9_9PEZI|nr:uroporphyrinogen-III synthase [Saxophila tyrrhenica]